MSAKIKRSTFRKAVHEVYRRALASLPTSFRFACYRLLAKCDPYPDARLQLKIAETKEELEDCFKILHDAYVASGFMVPHPTGMRITQYHALPTTTTLCAKYDGKVVGTISLIREGVFGFPLQSVFELGGVRAKGGRIAEVSALAVHPEFRKTGGAILFPLMKFMRDYCADYFDTRHIVIAVNPERIELYEALLFFERLQESVVQAYDYANGAPAVGATLDLVHGTKAFKAGYRGRPLHRNLYVYLFEHVLPNIQVPQRRYHTTNDPVMTPELLDHFFNVKTRVFEELDDRRKMLLWSIYQTPEYRRVLPMLKGESKDAHPLRRHQRFSLRCPAELRFGAQGQGRVVVLDVIEISLGGFQAESRLPVDLQELVQVHVELGAGVRSSLTATAVRRSEIDGLSYYGFRIESSDQAWTNCVAALEAGHVARDLLA